MLGKLILSAVSRARSAERRLGWALAFALSLLLAIPAHPARAEISIGTGGDDALEAKLLVFDWINRVDAINPEICRMVNCEKLAAQTERTRVFIRAELPPGYFVLFREPGFVAGLSPASGRPADARRSRAAALALAPALWDATRRAGRTQLVLGAMAQLAGIDAAFSGEWMVRRAFGKSAAELDRGAANPPNPAKSADSPESARLARLDLENVLPAFIAELGSFLSDPKIPDLLERHAVSQKPGSVEAEWLRGLLPANSAQPARPARMADALARFGIDPQPALARLAAGQYVFRFTGQKLFLPLGAPDRDGNRAEQPLRIELDHGQVDGAQDPEVAIAFMRHLEATRPAAELGHPRVAINFVRPNQPTLVLINDQAWQSMPTDGALLMLVLHEIFPTLGYSDVGVENTASVYRDLLYPFYRLWVEILRNRR